MRIEAVELHAVRIPFRRAFQHALHARREAETIVVVVRSESAQVGVGEIAPRPYLTGETIERVLGQAGPDHARRCLGRSFRSKDEVLSWLAEELHRSGRQLATLGGFELAILDLASKELGFTLGEVLGGVRGPPLPAGAVVGFEVATADLRRQCALLRVAGCRHLKLKVGRSDDLERAEIASGALGPGASFRLDANGAWSPAQAVECLNLMRRRCPWPIESVEQPVEAGDLDGMRRVRLETGLRVMADESLCTLEDGQRLLDAQAVDIFNIRIGKCGGLLGSLRLSALAASTGLGLHLGALVGETSVLSRSAELFGRCVAGFPCLEGKGQSRFLLEADVVREVEGALGLGVEILEGSLRRYEQTCLRFRDAPR